MKPSAIKDEIINLLEDIISRTNYISHHHPGKDLSLDIDLVKDDLRVLYRNFEYLKKLAAEQSPLSPKSETPKEETETMPGNIEAEHALTNEAIENQASSGDTSIQSSIIKESEKPGDDKADTVYAKEEPPVEAVDEAQAETPPGQPLDTIIAPLEKQEAKTGEAGAQIQNENTQKETTVSNGQQSVIDLLSAYSQKTIGDQYAQADNSLNKRISGQHQDNSIGARMQLNPISSIKEVIGVNEKFLFINELFAGNIQEYHDAVARLNAMESMQSAFDYLNELSKKYSWDAERSTATINKLATYVQRRYM